MSDQPSTTPTPPSAPESKPAPVPQSPIAAELSVQWDKAQAKAEAPVEKAGTPAAVAPGQGNVTPEGPKRDEGGRFAPKEDAKPKEAPQAKADAKADQKPAKAPADALDAKGEAKPEAKPDAKPEAKALAPHPRWKPEVQEKFTKLAQADPDLAQFVLERQKETEGEFTRARQTAVIAEKYKGLDDVLAPNRQARSMQGVDDPTFLRSLVAASDFLAKNPRDGIKMLAEQYGVPLEDLAKGAASAEEHPEIRELRKQVSEMQEFIRSQNEQGERQRVEGAFHSIQSFATAKDSNGELLYPYFRECIDDITTVVARQKEAGQQPDLKAAYEKAIRLNDAVWAKLQASKSEAERKQREEEEAQRVAQAKLAGFSVSGSGGGGEAVGGSIRDELRRQIDKHLR